MQKKEYIRPTVEEISFCPPKFNLLSSFSAQGEAIDFVEAPDRIEDWTMTENN